MTSRERVHTALRHEQPEFCSHNLSFTIAANQKMVEYTGESNFAEKIGNHLAFIEHLPPDAWVQVKPDFWQDQFGVVWNRTVDKNIGNPDGLIFLEPRLGDYQWPDPHAPDCWVGSGDKLFMFFAGR